MAKRDKDGIWEFDPEEEGQIEILARARVRADEIREERKAESEANKCDLCGKDKRKGEHGKGKCIAPEEKKKSKWGKGAE